MSYDSLKSAAVAAAAKAKGSAQAAALATQNAEDLQSQAVADAAAAAVAVMSIQPDPVVPPVVVPPVITVTNLKAVASARGTIAVSWTPPTPPPASYTVGRDGVQADGGGANWSGPVDGAATSQTFDKLQDGKEYTFTVIPAGGVPSSVKATTAAAPVTPPVTPPSGDPAPLAVIDWSGTAGSFPSAYVNPETGGGGWGNGELQVYTNQTKNASLDGKGNLVITCIRDSSGGFTSARLNTKGKLAMQPGQYVECPITMPLKVRGAFPAFWTIGANIFDPDPTKGGAQVGWPKCGEIDIVEGNGKGLRQTAAHQGRISNNGSDNQYPWYDAFPSDDSFLAGMYFDAERIMWFHNRTLLRQVVATPAALSKDGRKVISGDGPASTSDRTWPYNQGHYLIFNFAVDSGGAGFGGGVATFGKVQIWGGGNLPVKIAP